MHLYALHDRDRWMSRVPPLHHPTCINYRCTWFYRYAMRNAKLLSLVGQNLVEISDEVFENAKEAEVTCVDLSRNKLQRLSERMSMVVTTTDLKLSYNMLMEVPEWIGEQFIRLRYLDLSKNLLTSLPESLSSLQFLIEINISFNKYVRNATFTIINNSIKLMRCANNSSPSILKIRRATRLYIQNIKFGNFNCQR
jgi:Leucine-rich repeat (LRR) protein